MGRPRPKELMGVKISELDKDIKLQCNTYKRKGIARHVRWTKQGFTLLGEQKLPIPLKMGLDPKGQKYAR